MMLRLHHTSHQLKWIRENCPIAAAGMIPEYFIDHQTLLPRLVHYDIIFEDEKELTLNLLRWA